MEGEEVQLIVHLFDLYNENFLVVGVSLLSLTFISLLFLWNYNRKKFRALKHQLPASIMHSYLDSVIQNSQALKSSLFRGETFDSAGFSTMPIGSLVPPAAGLQPAAFLNPSIAGTSNSLSPDELMQKNAEINNLKSQLAEKQSIISDIEEKMTNTFAKLREAEEKIVQLQASLNGDGAASAAPVAAAAPAAAPPAATTTTPAAAAPAGDDSALRLQLAEVTKERDLLKEKLKEYEFIENDLAEIPRLQRTVDMLKRTLSDMGVDPDEKLNGGASSGEASTATASDASSPAEGTAPGAAMDEDEAAMAAAMGGGKTTPSEKKGPDDELLQQFEKMLG